MKGLVDRPASEVLAGDTIIEPWSGVVSKVLHAGPVGEMVVLQVRGLVASNVVHLSLPLGRVLSAYPRPEPRAKRADEGHPHRPGG